MTSLDNNCFEVRKISQKSMAGLKPMFFIRQFFLNKNAQFFQIWGQDGRVV